MSVSRTDLFEAVASAFRFSSPSRDELLLEAGLNEVDPEMIALLESLPARRFRDVRDIWSELPDLAVR